MTRAYRVEMWDANNEPSRIRRRRSFDTENMARAWAQSLAATYGYSYSITHKEPTK